MNITNKNRDGFMKAVNKCEGRVWLTSIYGDNLNLKSELISYVALERLMGEHGDELELRCDVKSDEANFLEFFAENPDAL